MKPKIWTMWALNVNYWVYSDSYLRFIYLFIYVFKTATEM